MIIGSWRWSCVYPVVVRASGSTIPAYISPAARPVFMACFLMFVVSLASAYMRAAVSAESAADVRQTVYSGSSGIVCSVWSSHTVGSFSPWAGRWVPFMTPT